MKTYMPDLLLLLLLLLLSTTSSTSTADTNSLVFMGCSQSKYSHSSPYEYNIDSLLSSLANASTFSPYANFTSSSATPSSPAYGLFQCQPILPSSTCFSCIRSALSQLSAICPSAAGAAVQLVGCFLRYGNDSFIGRPDTSLLYKKCGSAAAAATAGGLPSMRNAAIAAMQASAPQGGTYREGAAGYMRSEAQCVGDIGAKQCADCVSSAAKQIQDSCGLAVSGDVYLGKCYVRYWSDGVYNYHSSSDDEVGKTLAIIIGLMAGVALIIVFLSFIRKASSSKY